MENKILYQINSTLKSIVLKNQTINLLDNNLVKGLKFHKNTVSFTLELLPEQLKEPQEIKNIIEKKLLNIKDIQKVEIILTAHNVKKDSNNNSQNSLLKPATHIIAVASGKGGVGKSTTAINIALSLSKLKYKVGILDADIYGPSLPKLTGISNKPKSNGKKIIPHNAFGLQAMSIGYLVPEDAATIWRGPMVTSAIKTFTQKVNWKDLDFIIVDMPPGTGDTQLTFSQEIKMDGAIIVSTPQEVALLDVKRGIKMFDKLGVKILGLVDNMSYFTGDDGKKYKIFGEGGVKKTAEEFEKEFLGEIPINPEVGKCGDEGKPIVEANPDHEISKIYLDFANKIKSTYL